MKPAGFIPARQAPDRDGEGPRSLFSYAKKAVAKRPDPLLVDRIRPRAVPRIAPQRAGVKLAGRSVAAQRWVAGDVPLGKGWWSPASCPHSAPFRSMEEFAGLQRRPARGRLKKRLPLFEKGFPARVRARQLIVTRMGRDPEGLGGARAE